jgi:hypothetical protein
MSRRTSVSALLSASSSGHAPVHVRCTLVPALPPSRPPGATMRFPHSARIPWCQTRRTPVSDMLFDDSEETELEQCRGGWRPAMSHLAGVADPGPDIETAASVFERRVLPWRPLSRAAKTRKQYCRARRAVCTTLHVGVITGGAGAGPAYDAEGAAKPSPKREENLLRRTFSEVLTHDSRSHMICCRVTRVGSAVVPV